MWCYIGVRMKHENLVLSSELMKVELSPFLTFALRSSLRRRTNARKLTSAFQIFLGGNSTFMNWLIKLNFIIFQISLVLLNCYSQKHPEFHEAWPQSLVSVNSSLQFPSAREHRLDLVCSPKHVLEHSLHELQALYWPSVNKKKIFDGGSRQFW